MDHIPMADSIGIGWRNESYSGGAFNHIQVAACVGIFNLTNFVIINFTRFFHFHFITCVFAIIIMFLFETIFNFL